MGEARKRKTADRFQSEGTSRVLFAKLGGAAINFLIGCEVVGRYEVSINYGESLGEMIHSASFDEVHPRISGESFRIVGSGNARLELTMIRFIRPVSPSDAAGRMLRQGYRSGMIEELIALGRKYPDLQRGGPIVALGSGMIIDERRYTPILGGSVSMRSLSLAVIYRKWSTAYRYVFVKR